MDMVSRDMSSVGIGRKIHEGKLFENLQKLL